MNPRLLTPVISAGAAWATRKSMNAMCAKRREGPGAVAGSDRRAVPQVLIWSLSTALVVALIDVAIQQQDCPLGGESAATDRRVDHSCCRAQPPHQQG